MKTVWLLTNLHEKCGVAEYGRDLRDELAKYYRLVVDDSLEKVDLVLVNWHNARLTVEPQHVRNWQRKGAKVVIILHNSFSGIRIGSADKDILATADAVVAHEPMVFDVAPKRFFYIKHGLPVVELYKKCEDMIGTAGFPFPWKRMELVADVAKRLGVKCLIIAPKHEETDTEMLDQIEKYMAPWVTIIREWLPKEKVVQLLSRCKLNIFWFQEKSLADQLGQSGSVLMGVAAGRPMILSNYRKFRVLLTEYREEFYVAPTREDIYYQAKDIFSLPETSLRKPKLSRMQMSWPVIGEQYRTMIEEVTG
jgi:glycosyltransferase involved in cell wall biosynthesis